MLPVDRMRRFVTPVDIDGSGRASALGRPLARGRCRGRQLRAGRLRRLLPPPGAPGLISVDPGGGATPGTIVYPSASNDLFYTSGPNPANLTFPSYLPDVTNNPLHGFEAAKNPNLPGANGGYAPRATAACPPIENVAGGIPSGYPTYDLNIRTNGLNEADEMNLYLPDAQLDSAVRPRRSGMALPLAGRRRPLAGLPAGRPCPGQLHQHHRRPTPAPAVRGRELGVEPVRLGQRQPRHGQPECAPGHDYPVCEQCDVRRGANAGFPYLGAAPGLSTPPLAHRDKKLDSCPF